MGSDFIAFLFMSALGFWVLGLGFGAIFNMVKRL
jgi:hypothetical protein